MTAKVHRATTWPLLRKDLTEMAAQGRGYWLRAGVVALGYAGFVWLYRAYGFNLRTEGVKSFILLNGFMAGAVTLFTPLAIASAIAGEKERNAFALLLVTPLTCWELLLEKFVARLVPLAGMMMCTLPLYAVCYSHGGIEPATLAGVAGLQLANLLLAGAVGLCMSCRFQSTLAAVLMSWLFWGVVFVAAIVMMNLARWDEDLALGLFGFVHAVEARFHPTFSDDLWRFACLLGPAFLLLLAARHFLLRHAFRKAGNRRLSLVRWLHRRLDWMTGRLRGGSMLPGRDAFLWRELHRLGIATFRFKVRLAVTTFLTSLLICVVIMMFGTRDFSALYEGVNLVAWIFMAITATVLGISSGQMEARKRTAETLSLSNEGMAGAIKARMLAMTTFLFLMIPALALIPISELSLGSWYGFRTFFKDLGADPIYATILLYLVLPFFFIRYGLWFGTMFKGATRALAAAVIVAMIWVFSAEYLSQKVYTHFELKLYRAIEYGEGEYTPRIGMEAARRRDWIFSVRLIASPAGLPMKIFDSRPGLNPVIPGGYAALYLSLGMLLQHRTLRRIRRRYG